MNLLTYTNELWNFPSLQNVAIMGAQHIMESTLLMFRNFIANGLDPKKVFLIGKCYSTSRSVYKDFHKEGIHVCPSSFLFDSHESYDHLYKQNIEKFVTSSFENLSKANIKKLIVLDDGGYLIDAMNSLNTNGLEIVSIEQTSAGINHLKKTAVDFPIFNVARSKAKLELETPFIVDSSLQRLWKHVDPETINSVLVLGCGSIGKEVAKKLNHYDINAYDPLYHPEESLPSLLRKSDLIIGCSGTTSLKSSNYNYLKEGAYLASFSSSDREFDAPYFRRLSPPSNNCLLNFKFGATRLIQGGFPINFWGSRNNIPFIKIQLTLSLLTSAIYEAAGSDNLLHGIQAINPNIEEKLMAAYSMQHVKKATVEIFPISQINEYKQCSIGNI